MEPSLFLKYFSGIETKLQSLSPGSRDLMHDLLRKLVEQDSLSKDAARKILQLLQIRNQLANSKSIIVSPGSIDLLQDVQNLLNV